MKKEHRKVSFRVYGSQETLRLDSNLGSYVPVGHVARLVNDAIDSYDLSALLSSYKGGGTSSYHPRLLVKCLIYSYINKVYSSRRIEQLMRENVIMMWLCSQEVIDHNTINNFRKGVLKDHFDSIFSHVLGLLVEQGHLKLQRMHTDGTKMEANANRYTFVWGKSVGKHKEKLSLQIKDLMQEIAVDIAAEEAADEALLTTPPVSALDAASLQSYITEVNEKIEKKIEKQVEKIAETAPEEAKIAKIAAKSVKKK